MKLLILFAFSAFSVNAASILDPDLEEWNAFKLQYKKTYDTMKEEKYRMSIFMENKKKIEEHNERYNKGEVTYEKGINQFADMLHSEALNWYTGYKPSAKKHNVIDPPIYIPPKNGELPDTVDWREKGAVTPVKNQKHCGSCYAFSATGALEGQHFLKTKNLVSLSEQNLVDCSQSEGNSACLGGFPSNCFDYIKTNEGIDTEASYPYEGTKDNYVCRFNANNVGATDTGYVNITSGDEGALQSAVANVGPISVAICTNDGAFWFYKQGVFVSDLCENGINDLNHAVLAVGYGTENGTDYWLVKNSWGEDWGDQGYIKMARNHNNMCGIATDASYPTV